RVLDGKNRQVLALRVGGCDGTQEPLKDRPERGLRLAAGHTRPEPSQNLHPVPPWIVESFARATGGDCSGLKAGVHRGIHVMTLSRTDAEEPGVSDANDGEGNLVDDDALTERLLRPAEVPLGEPIAHNGDRGYSLLVVLCDEKAAGSGRSAQQAEKSARAVQPFNDGALAFNHDRSPVHRPKGHDLGEYGIAVAQSLKGRPRQI